MSDHTAGSRTASANPHQPGWMGLAIAVATLLTASVVAQKIINAPTTAAISPPCTEHQKRIKAVDQRLAGWEERIASSSGGVVVLQRSDVRYVRALLQGPGAPTSGPSGAE